MKNNTMDELKELEKEFWGILLFETNLKGLYLFLGLNDMGLSLTTFANWVVFPEYIPPDIRRHIRSTLMNRHQEQNYMEEKKSNVELTESETQLYEQTNELIRFKFFNHITHPQNYKYLYQLNKEAFERVLKQFNEAGYSDNETLFKYYSFYSNREREDI